MTTAPSSSPYRFKTLTSLVRTDHVGSEPSSARTYDLRVENFDHKSKSPSWPRRHRYVANMLRGEPRAAQLHRAMVMFQRVGFGKIELAGDSQTAILSPGPAESFLITVRYDLDRGRNRDEAFAAWCMLLIDENSRGIESLLLTEEMASLETDIGQEDDDLDNSGVRVVRSEIDRLLQQELLRIRC